MRWSFRKSLEMGLWQSKDHRHTVNYGDEVYLFCHSMMLGLFRDPDAPPRVGNPVCRSFRFPDQIKASSPAKSWTWATMFYELGCGEALLTDNGVLMSKLAGNAVAAEAQARAAQAPKVIWRGAFDHQAENEAAARKEDKLHWQTCFDSFGLNRSGTGPYAAFSPGKKLPFEGTRVASNMLQRMANDGFLPVRFRVRFVD